jgi:pyruvate carboxylase
MASKNGKYGKGGKYAKELERLRELNAINEVLKKSDIENAALTNTSKDSETVNDNAIDNMLDQLNIDKNANKDLQIVESLTSSSHNARPSYNRSAKPQRKVAKANKKKISKKPKPKGKKKR